MKTVVIKYHDNFDYLDSNSNHRFQDFLIKILTFWIPKASPDYDKKLRYLVFWYIEIDVETGRAEREIGFNKNNEPIIHAPDDINYGLWTDSDRIFNIENYQIIDKEVFDKLWNHLLTHDDNT